jgi:RNA polymerase sigma-70 factor (ECF subfamily)
MPVQHVGNDDRPPRRTSVRGMNRRPASEHAAEAGLLRAVARGDAAAAHVLIARYWDDAYRVAFLLVHDQGAAEEIAQDALLRAVDSIGSFDLERPFRPWVQRIAANRAVDRLRYRGRRPELIVEQADLGEHDSDAVADAVAREALSDELLAALAILGPEFRMAVVLRHLLDYEPQEIAEIVGVPATTVRTRIHRGLLQLRDALSEEGARADERLG